LKSKGGKSTDRPRKRRSAPQASRAKGVKKKKMEEEMENPVQEKRDFGKKQEIRSTVGQPIACPAQT